MVFENRVYFMYDKFYNRSTVVFDRVDVKALQSYYWQQSHLIKYYFI